MAEQNKALVARFIDEIFNRGNMSAADELLAPNFVEHEHLPAGVPRDREGVKMLSSMLRSAFPDLKVTIDDTIVEGDKVVVRMTWSGTHRGEFMGVPASGKSVSIGVIDIIRVSGGKLVEHWGQMDAMAMLQQIGALPAPVEG